MPKHSRPPEIQAYNNALKRIRTEFRIIVDEILNEVEPELWRRYEQAALTGQPVDITINQGEAREKVRGLLNA